MYIKETTQLAGPFGTMPREHRHPGKGAKLDCAIQLNYGKCTPMQVIKQSEHGRTSTAKEQKWSFFRTNHDQ